MTKQVGVINSIMIKKDNIRLTITLDPEHLQKIEFVKRCLGSKNNQKTIYLLLDLYCLDEPPYKIK